MIISMPLDENKVDVCPSFARAYFMLFKNTETNEVKILDNPAAAAEGGAGIAAAQFLVDSGADCLVTYRCGQNAADVFKLAELKVYKAVGKTAAENIEAMESGKLEEMTTFHAGYHGKH